MNFFILFSGYNILITENIQNIYYRPHVLFLAFIIFLGFIAFVSLRSLRKRWEFYEAGIENIIKEANFLAKFPKYSIPLLIMLILVYFLSGGDHINKFYSLIFFDYRGLYSWTIISRHSYSRKQKLEELIESSQKITFLLSRVRLRSLY
jgi:hypothetical protein